jgi:hypothetical protein
MFICRHRDDFSCGREIASIYHGHFSNDGSISQWKNCDLWGKYIHIPYEQILQTVTTILKQVKTGKLTSSQITNKQMDMDINSHKQQQNEHEHENEHENESRNEYESDDEQPSANSVQPCSDNAMLANVDISVDEHDDDDEMSDEVC